MAQSWTPGSVRELGAYGTPFIQVYIYIYIYIYIAQLFPGDAAPTGPVQDLGPQGDYRGGEGGLA